MPWPAVLAALLVVADTTPAAAQAAYEHLRIIAPAAPGGGWDQTARVMQQVLQSTGIARTVSVENIPGAAGTIGLARFIGAERGRGDASMVSGLIMLGAIVTNRSPVTLNDVTPIARLTGEYEVIAVPATSPLRTLQDFIDPFKARPESISWGGGSAGGSDQILAGLIADAVGVSPRRVNYIAFSGGGESLSAILGGQVSVGVNGLAEFAPHIQSGAVRVLAISSGERLPGLDAPTLREQGVDVEFENWRSVVAPPGISRADRQRLEAAIDAMVRSAAWRDALARYRWLDRYLAGDGFARFVEAEEARVQAILRELGTARRDTSGLASAGPYPVLVLAGLTLCGLAAALRAFRSSRAPARESAGPSWRERRPDRLRQGYGGRPKLHAKAEGLRLPRPIARETVGPGWRPIALVAAGIGLHLALAERAGFVIASAALFWLTARAFDTRHPARDAVFAIGVSVGTWLLFARVLQLSLPAGLLAGWF